VRTYRQYCPIARASEVLAERWTPLIVRNLLSGASTFTEISRGVPAMSRSLLTSRLRQLERAGVVRTVARPGGGRGGYALTQAGADLASVITALGEWGERWLEVTTEHCDPGFALWAWSTHYVDRDALPPRRVVVRFTFPQEAATNRRYWLLVEPAGMELCYSDPCLGEDLLVEAESVAFVRWHTGEIRWPAAVRSGAFTVTGSRELARALPTWHCAAPTDGG
jgi:DNA-binding HxlR family transcriptional regulator